MNHREADQRSFSGFWRRGQSARLSHLLALGVDTRCISKAIGRLRENFDQPLRMDDIAHELGMSISGFHHHFKSVTAMSPRPLLGRTFSDDEAKRGDDVVVLSYGFWQQRFSGDRAVLD